MLKYLVGICTNGYLYSIINNKQNENNRPGTRNIKF